MNEDNGAFQRGTFSGDWGPWNSLQSAGRYALHGSGGYGKNPFWLFGVMIGMFLGALSGAKAGGFFTILLSAFAGAVILGVLFAMPKLIWKAARFTIGRTIKIFRHQKI